MKKAVAYTRFSSENQNDVSIEAQMRAIKEYAVKNDYEIVKQYIDRAKSASSDKRPEFQKMIKDSKSGNFDAVIIHKIDRFARNMKDAAWYKAELNQFNVDLLSVNEDLTGESGDLVFNIMASVADWYLKNLKNEIDTKVRITAEKGYFLGGIPPFGFSTEDTYEEMKYGDRIKKIKRKKYIINEEEAKIVRYMFDLAEKGFSTINIQNKLNEEGYKTRKGKKWHYSSIYDMLHNPKYSGTYVYARGNHRTSHIKRDDAVVIPNAIPEIISQEKWESVQKEMKKRRRIKSNTKQYLLKRLIYCGECKNHMIPYGGNYSRYVCSKWESERKKGIKPDHFMSIAKDKVENYVIDFMINEVFKNTDTKIIADNINKLSKIKLERSKENINKLNENIEKLKLKKERLEKNYLNAVESGLESSVFLNRIKEIKNNLKELKNEFDQKDFRLPDIDEKIIQDMLNDSLKKLLSGSFEEKRKLLSEIIERVEIRNSNNSKRKYINIKLKGVSLYISKLQDI